MKRWICAFLALVLVLSAVPWSVSAASMNVSNSLLDVLKSLEGFRAKPYWDTDHWAIGYGTSCPEDKRAEYETTGITKEMADKMLRDELKAFVDDVNDFAVDKGLNFSQHQFDALVSFSYNCGSGWIYETDGVFHNAVCKGYTGSKFIYAIGLYSFSDGTYTLMQRRLCEANMYLNGVYKAYNATSNPYPSTYRWVYLDGNGGKVRYSIYAFDAAEKPGVDIIFTDIPTGTDSNGNPFAYDFAGWYTAQDKQVTALDASLAKGTMLYAKWRDPSGNIVTIEPSGEPTDLTVTVTEDTVNVRSGPATSYSKVGTVKQGEKLQLTMLHEEGGYTWGKFAKGWLRLDFTDYDQVKPGEFPKMGTINDTVNYRSEPVVSADTLLGQKYEGDRVTITEEWYSGTMWWGKMSDGNWVSLQYVTYDEDVVPVVTGIQMWRMPNKMVYIQGDRELDTTGGVLLITYDKGPAKALSLTESMISGFNSANLGTVPVNVTYEGKTITIPVTVQGRPGTVTFKNYDGTIISSRTYNYGDSVTPPSAPERPAENGVAYIFVGWDKEVTVFQGDVVYTAVFRPVAVKGDVTGDNTVNNDDVVLLLWNTLFPEDYPISADADFTGDGKVNNDDVVLLLWHTLFPADYPI